MSKQQSKPESEQAPLKRSLKRRHQAATERARAGNPAAEVSSIDLLPDHDTARSLRQSTVLRLQKRHGNAFVQRALAARDGTLTSRLEAATRPAPAESASGLVQRSLSSDLDQALDVYGPIDYDGLLKMIHAAPVAERQAALGNAKLRKKIRSRFSGDPATTLMSALLEGSQHWKNPPSNDFFDYFVVKNGKGTLPNAATMNCWESILYAAYMAGEIDTKWIVKFYKDAFSAADPNDMIWSLLGWSTALPKYPKKKPTTGQLLFYYTGGTRPGHVALSLGGDEAMSLWNQPKNEYAVQRIKVTDLSGTVYVGDSPW